MFRKPNQKKKSSLGIKSKRGQPELYSERKKRYNLSLTQTSVNKLDSIAESLDISRSELIERISRKRYGILTYEVSQDHQTNFSKEGRKRFNFSLTPTAIRNLDLISASLEISRSELVERIGCSHYEILFK